MLLRISVPMVLFLGLMAAPYSRAQTFVSWRRMGLSSRMRKTSFFTLFAVAFINVVAVYQAPAQTWSVPSALNTNANSDLGSDREPRLSTDGRGNWVCVWESEETLGGTLATDMDIFVSRSTDGGVSWTGPVPLNSNAATDGQFGDDDITPQIETDGSGNWICVWGASPQQFGNDGEIMFARSFNNGSTWSTMAPLNSNAATDSNRDVLPKIATDGNGNWVCAWVSRIGSGDTDLLVSRSADNGENWTAPAALNTNASTDSGNDSVLEIATDYSGNWLVVWTSYENLGGAVGTEGDILVSRSADNGENWTAPAVLNTDATSDVDEDFYPDIATDRAGNWVCIWQKENSQQGTLTDVFVSRSMDSGATWTTPAFVGSKAGRNVGAPYNPQIATDRQGNWIFVYSQQGLFQGDQDVGNRFSRSVDNGMTWTSPTFFPGQPGGWQLSVKSDGVADWLAVWSSTDPAIGASGGEEDIAISRSIIAIDLPTVGLSSGAGDPVNGAIVVTAALSETSTDFESGDVTPTNATVSGFSGSGTSYSFTLTPITDGVFRAVVNAGSFTNSAGSPNASSNTLTRTADLTAPMVTLNSATGDPVSGPILVSATLSEPSVNFTSGDVTAVNATVGAFSGSGASYNFTLTPLASGLFSATVNAGIFTDAVGNPNTVSNTLTRTANLGAPVAPTVSLSSAAGNPVGGQISVSAALSAVSTNFTSADVTPVNATVSGFSGSGASYTFTLTPLTDGLFSATVGAGVFTDALGTPNLASNTLSRTADFTPPLITLLGNSPISIECGTPYVDAGATAADGVDGVITSSIVIVDSVNEFVLGSYFVTYDVVDAAGNAAVQVVRIVNVVDTTKPLIQLMGSGVVNVPKDSVYVDAGATASDSCEGDLTASIATQSDVDTSIPGFYNVDYTVSDTSGNTAEAARIVVVAVDNEDPCSALREAIETEWALLAADLGLNPNIVEAPGNRIPERWALAMVRQIICRTSHPHHLATVEAYLHNLMMLETEPPLVANQVAPYRHVLAALLLVNQSRQDHFKSLLGLTNMYDVVRGPGRGVGQEIFGDDGDLDGDGITNADEYDSVVVVSGDIEDFAEIVIKAALAMSLISALIAFLTIIMLTLVLRRQSARRLRD